MFNRGIARIVTRLVCFYVLAIAFTLFLAGENKVRAQSVPIPNFWNPDVRFVKPDLSTMPRLKFLTTTDFPPFNFIDRQKNLVGFHIDLARAICDELNVLNICEIQALPWENLDAALVGGEGDAIIAGIAVTAKSRKKYSFTHPYLTIPGRFVTLRNSKLAEPIYNSLYKKTVGVVEKSGHEAFFSQSFKQRKYMSFSTRVTAYNALKNGTVDAVFTDALSASFWLASESSQNCCSFSGEAYLSEQYFGSGLAIAAPVDQIELINGFNYALKEINDSGKFAELYLKYFPLGLY